MRHKKRRGKLSRTAAHRSAMFSNMAVSLLQHEQIVTTVAKAKQLRPFVEKLVSKSAVCTLHVRRSMLSILGDQGAVSKLIVAIAPRYSSRPGGYLRIIKHKFRAGDRAEMAVIEFVDRDVSAKGMGFTDQGFPVRGGCSPGGSDN